MAEEEVVEEELNEDAGYEIDDDEIDKIEEYIVDDDQRNRRNPQEIQFTKLMIDTSKDVPQDVVKDKRDRLVWSLSNRHRQLTFIEDQAGAARKWSEDRSVFRTILWTREGDTFSQNDLNNIRNYSHDLTMKAINRGERTAYVLRQQNINQKVETSEGPPKQEVPAGGMLSAIGQTMGFKKKRSM